LDDNGRAVIDGCQPGKRYYIRMDPFTNQQQVDEWLNGYKRIIQHLSEFLESEWDNVHEQRWQIFDTMFMSNGGKSLIKLWLKLLNELKIILDQPKTH